MRPRTTAVAMLIVLSGCPKAVPPPGPVTAPTLTAEQQLAKEVAALGGEAPEDRTRRYRERITPLRYLLLDSQVFIA